MLVSLLLAQPGSRRLTLWRGMIWCRCWNGSPIEIKTVFVNRLGAATGERLSATRLFLCGLWLLLDLRITAFIVAREILRRDRPAKVAVQALVTNVKPSSHIVGHPCLEGVE